MTLDRGILINAAASAGAALVDARAMLTSLTKRHNHEGARLLDVDRIHRRVLQAEADKAAADAALDAVGRFGSTPRVTA